VFDPLYVQARAALLDAAEALAAQLDAVVLVGAQAIYVHTGDADLAVAEYTTDADFAVSPVELAAAPLLGELLEASGFAERDQPGAWLSPGGVSVDFLVPESLAGSGTRGARLGPHGKRVARRAKGLEGALVDRAHYALGSLDSTDTRQVSLWVAGPGALLVAKVHKIAERVGHHDRVRDKDALDVLRLLRAVDTDDVAGRLRLLVGADLAAGLTAEALELLPLLFGDDRSEGVAMAVRAAGGAEEDATIAASLIALVTDLKDSLDAG